MRESRDWAKSPPRGSEIAAKIVRTKDDKRLSSNYFCTTCSYLLAQVFEEQWFSQEN